MPLVQHQPKNTSAARYCPQISFSSIGFDFHAETKKYRQHFILMLSLVKHIFILLGLVIIFQDRENSYTSITYLSLLFDLQLIFTPLFPFLIQDALLVTDENYVQQILCLLRSSSTLYHYISLFCCRTEVKPVLVCTRYYENY